MKGFLYSIVAGVATLTLSAVTLWAGTIDIPAGTSKTYNEVAGNTITGAGSIKVDNTGDVETSTNVSGFTGTVDLCGDVRYIVKNQQDYLGTNVNYTVSGNNQLMIEGVTGALKSLSISSQGTSVWGGGLRLSTTTLSVTDGISVTGNARLSNVAGLKNVYTSTLNSDITIADGCTLGFDTCYGSASSSNFIFNGSITGTNSTLTFGENYTISHTNATYTLGKGKDGTSSGTYNVKSISALAGSTVNFNTGTITTDSLSAENTATLTMNFTDVAAKTISNAGTMTQKGGTLTPGGKGTVGTTTIQSGTYTLSKSDNLALNKTAKSLNGEYGSGFSAAKAVDGNTGTFFISKDGGSVQDHALIVDLGSTYTLNNIWYLDREVGGYNPMSQSGNYFQFYMYDADNNLTYTSEQFTNYTTGGTTYNLGSGATGQYLKIVEHVPRSGEGNTYFEIAELQTYSNATLSFDLGSGDNYDKLVINSGATLKLDGANLSVNLLDSFNPETTSSFQILDIQGTLSGTFSSMSLPSTWGYQILQWNTDSLYTAGTLSVQAVDRNLYPVTNSWNTALTVDGTTWEGMRFDSTTADAGVTEATHTGGLTLNSDAIINVGEGYTLIEASTDVTWSNTIIKIGAGTAIISPNSSVHRKLDSIKIDGGLLQISSPDSGGYVCLTATDAITFGDNGGTLDSPNNLWFSNSDGFKITTSEKSNNQNYITSTGSVSNRGLNIGGGGKVLTVDTPTNGDLEISARIWNGGKLIKTGTGTLTLSGDNDKADALYTDTDIQAGTLKLAGVGTLGSGSVSIGANGTLEINVAAEASKTVTNSFSGAGTVKKTGAGTAYLTINEKTQKNIGSIVIDGGLFQVANKQGSLCITNKDAITFGDNGGTFDSPYNLWCNNSEGFKITTSAKSNNQNYIISSFLGSDGAGLNIGGGNKTLIVETPANGDLTISARIWNEGKLIKTGAGTLALSGTNHTGKQPYVDTVVQAGTLKLLDANALGTGTVTVNENGTLEFDCFEVQSGKLTVDKNGVLDFDFGEYDANDASNYGSVQVTDLSLDLTDKYGLFQLSFGDDEEQWLDGATTGSGYKLIATDANNLYLGDLTDFLAEGTNNRWILTGLSDGIYLTASASTGVPEPSTWALLILGMAGLMKVASCELRVARKK